ncbi:MAG: hypothetical protein IJA27_06795, partial [Lachnospiraceae bacterium]|nr:hypothetical protein [Lachnospiraceae bacterium]
MTEGSHGKKMNKKEKNQTKNNRYDAENMQDRKQRRFKIHKRVWKKVTAILLVCTMMPFSDLAQADIYETLTKVYADEETQNTQEDSTVKLTLEGEMDGNANNILSWKQAEEVEELGEIKSYQIYRDGVKIAETTECTYTDTCTGAGETYCYQVQAEVETTTIFSNEIDLQMPEALVIDSDYRLEENMQVYCVDIQSGSLDLNGYNLEVCRDVNVNGMLKFNKGILVCGGDIRFQKGAECRMRYDDDYLYVGGDFRDEEFKRENTVAFENGKIVLKGNFKVNHGMLFSGTTLRFEGVKKQVIDCQSTMGSVVFNNVSDEGIEILGDLDRTSSINNESGCRVIWSDEIIKESVGWTLSEDMTIKDNLCITEGSLDLNGHTLNVQGDLSMLDGEINLNGGTLNVEGDMSFNQGTLNMNHGTLVVAQDFNCELYVFGGNNYRGYAQIIMNYEDDRIEIQGSCMLDSLGNISFANGVVEVEGALYIEGDIEIGNQFKAGFCRNDIGVLTISGMLEVESYNYGDGAGIDMDKGRMVVQERFGAGGMVNGNGLRMTHPEDYLCVYGDFDNMEFYDESTGYTIQSGTIELKGRSNSIYAYGDSKVVISGDVAQYVYGEAVNVEVRNSSVNEIDISYLTAENIEYIDVTPSYQGIALTSGWTLTEDTVINGDFALKEGVLDLNGHSLTVNGEFCHYGGTLQFNGGTCAITGDYTFVSENNKDEARLLMENPADYFKVGGNFCMQEYEVSNLIDGVLEIKGNICGYSIISSQNHKIVLSGEQEQKVECSTGYSQFHILESRNKSEEGIVLTGWYNIEQFIQNGNVVSYSFQEGNFGHTLQEDEVYEGDFYLADDELNLNGHTLHVKGDFIQNGGAIHIQNGHLIVDGDYKSVCGSNVWSGDYSLCGVKSGALSMQGEDSEITIKGSLFISIGNYAEWNLEAGRINVAGDMNIQSQPVITYGENFAFCFNGSIKQEISSKNRFTIQNIMFQNTRAQRGITCTSGNIIVSGNIYSNGICYVDNLRISETASLKDNNFWGSVYFLSDYVIEEGVSIRGSINGTRELKVNGTLNLEGGNSADRLTVVVNGTLNVKDSVSLKSMIVNGTVNGGKIDIEGSLLVSGVMNQITDISLTEGNLTMENGSIYADSIQLTEKAQISMTHADDYIKTGNLEYSSLKASELSDGILELTKDATLNCYFSTTGNHKMLLSGESEQSIIASRGKVILEQVEINQLEKAGVYIDYNVYIKKLLDKNNAQKLLLVDYILKEDLVIDEDVYLYAGKLDLNGHHLTVNGDFIYTDGYIKLSNGELEITGNYYNENPKGENIENPNLENVIKEDSNDYYGTVNIAGNVYLTGTDTDFQYNTVTIGGDIITNGSGMCIQPKTLTLTGKDVSIEKGALTSVTNLTLLCDSLKLENDLYIYGKFNPGTVVFDKENMIYLGYLSDLETDSIQANVTVVYSTNSLLTHDIDINGSLTVTGGVCLGTHKVTADSIDIEGGRVYVQSGTLISRGDLNISYLKFGSYCKQGMLLMQEQDGYVLVHGDFNIDYVNGYIELLTAGTLEIRGDFNNKGNGYFCASESHKTIFSMNKTDDIQYIQKITKNKNNFSKFNTIVLTRRIDAGYQFDCDIEQMCNQLIYEYDDSTPPTAVTGLKVTDTTLTTVTLAYKEATDNTGFVRYRIYRNGEEIADLGGSVLTYNDTELTPGTEYIYTVESYDDCNNPCEAAPEVSTQTKTDTENPSAPTSLSVIKRSGSSITIRWNPAQDNVKIGGYELYRNGEKIADITEGVSYQDTGLSVNTAYEYKVCAYDTSRNYSAFAQSVTSYVATPKIMEIIPADNEIFGGNSIHIIVFAKNYRAGDKYEAELLYRKKGEEYQVICANLDMNHYYNWEMNSGGYIWNLTDLTEGGEYDIKCILRDEDGNTTERVVTFYLDREAPETPKQVEGKTDNGTNVIGFDASTSADCVGYRIYRKDADNTVFTLHDTLSGQFNVHYTDNQVVWGQEYTYAISAIDKFGNESALTEEITIATEEDQTPPQITGITPDDKRVNGVISVEVYASDNVGVNSIHLWYQSEEDSLREELAALTKDITQSGMAYTNAQMLLENGLTNSDTEYNRIYLGEVLTQNGTASFSFDTTKLEDGAYILKAVAVDASGNESEQDYTKRYEVDNTGISKIELADCTTSSTSAQLRWNDVEESDFAYFAVERVIEVERATDSDETDTEDLPDGTNADNLTAITTERIATVTNTLGYNITGLTPGTTYHFQVVGYDALGNRGIPSDVMELTTTDDTINPVINSILPVPSKYKNQIQLSMQVSDNYAISKGVFSYSLDGADFITLAEVAAGGKSSETISYTMDLSELPEGEVYIRFEAYDAAGNKNALLKDGSDVIATYQIDRTPPA